MGNEEEIRKSVNSPISQFPIFLIWRLSCRLMYWL